MRRLASIIVALALVASPLEAGGPFASRQGNIDREQPVNRLHPLFKNCTNWYMTLPDRRGGTNVRDLMRVIDGTLTNSGTSTKGWSSWSRPNGFGSIAFDVTSNSYILVSSLSQFNYVQNTMVFTIAFWMSTNSLTTRQTIMQTNGFSSANKGFLVTFENGVGFGTQAILLLVSAGGGTQVYFARTGDNVITDNLWHQVVISGNGTSATFSVDGVSQSVIPITNFNTLSTGNSTFNLSIAYDNANSNLPFGGNIDDVTFFNTTFSASDVMNLYNLSKQGYPGVLNRQKPTFFNLFANGAAPPPTATPLRTLLGVGL